MHVLRDLQPYSCTFDECVRSHKTFGSRHEWFDHEAQHRKQWLCNYCTQSFSSVSKFSSHLEAGHPTAYASHQLLALKDMCARPIDKRSLAQCPLCLKEGQQLRSHLARHLRTLALFVMPKTIDVKLDEDESNGVQLGGSEDREDIDAQFDPLSDSDRMSEVSDRAIADVPEFEDHGQDLTERLTNVPARDPLEVFKRDQSIVIWNRTNREFEFHPALFDPWSFSNFILRSVVETHDLSIYHLNEGQIYQSIEGVEMQLNEYVKPTWRLHIGRKIHERFRFLVVDSLPDEVHVVVGYSTSNEMGIHFHANVVAHSKDSNGSWYSIASEACIDDNFDVVCRSQNPRAIPVHQPKS